VSFRTPVLFNKVIEVLEVTPQGLFIDCTLGHDGEPTEKLERAYQMRGGDISKVPSYNKAANLINNSRYLQTGSPVLSLAKFTDAGANNRFETWNKESREDKQAGLKQPTCKIFKSWELA
jgi:16S rRNA C1402 N4-methylase RsmH